MKQADLSSTLLACGQMSSGQRAAIIKCINQLPKSEAIDVNVEIWEDSKRPGVAKVAWLKVEYAPKQLNALATISFQIVRAGFGRQGSIIHWIDSQNAKTKSRPDIYLWQSFVDSIVRVEGVLNKQNLT